MLFRSVQKALAAIPLRHTRAMLHPRQPLGENGRLQGTAERLFWGTAGLIALTFCALFFTLVVPPVVSTSDFMRAALFDGFVNPTARGYTLDTLCTGLLVLAWIAYERVRYGIRHGWVAALLVFVPGVVVGLAVYLWLRSRHAAERLGPEGLDAP